jgi:hypothetical protein
MNARSLPLTVRPTIVVEDPIEVNWSTTVKIEPTEVLSQMAAANAMSGTSTDNCDDPGYLS